MHLVFLSQKMNGMFNKNLWLIVGGKGVLYNFSCNSKNLWYIIYDEGSQGLQTDESLS